MIFFLNIVYWAHCRMIYWTKNLISISSLRAATVWYWKRIFLCLSAFSETCKEMPFQSMNNHGTPPSSTPSSFLWLSIPLKHLITSKSRNHIEPIPTRGCHCSPTFHKLKDSFIISREDYDTDHETGIHISHFILYYQLTKICGNNLL